MIAPTDRIALPAGVVLADGRLVDPVRERPIQLNPTGAFVAACADGRTAAQVAADLVTATGAPPAAALADTLAFCAELNRHGLLNVAHELRSAVRRAAALRYGLRPAGPTRRGGLWTMAAPAVVLAWLGALGALPLAVASGRPGLAALAGLALAGGLILHEAGHVAALRGVPWCLTSTGLRVSVLHRALPPARRAAVAAAGPLLATAAGVSVLGAGWLLQAEAAALAAGPLVSHALALTVLAADGRTACGLS